MKKIFFITAAACMLFAAAGAQEKSSFSYIQNDNNKGVSTREITHDGLHLKVEYTGDITLNDSETAIESITPGGMVKYWKNDNRLVAENKSGVTTYEMYENGEKLDNNSDRAAKFMAGVVRDLIDLGFDVPQRVARIYKRGGTDAVLNEIAGFKYNFAKQGYFEELLKIGTLSAGELNAVAKSMGATLDGNYEKGQILQKSAGAYLKNPETTQAYFDAVATISGNYEKGQTLQAALQQHLTPAATGQLLTAAATISGDYEKAELLKKVARASNLNEENCNKLLNDADGINGSYEKAGVLQEIIVSDSLSKNSFALLLKVAGHVNGAYEKSGVLKAAAAEPALSDDEWVTLINTTASISGAYEKSQVLVTIAGKMPSDAKIHDAYMETAKTIISDYEYQQAVKAVR